MDYCKVDGRRAIIPELLEEWDQTLRRMESAFGRYDLPYVYRERTNVGIVAAAAARLGHVVLEEYSRDKGLKRRRRTGRADLYICSKDGRRDCNIEAKYLVVNPQDPTVTEKAGRLLELATNDVEQLRDVVEADSIGMVFLRPSLSSAKSNDFDAGVFWNRLQEAVPVNEGFCALHVCDFEIWSRQKWHVGCPGIAVVGKYV